MACVNADGTLSPSGQAMLHAIGQPATSEEVAAATGLALFRVRSGLRELVAAGKAKEIDGRYRAAQSIPKEAATS